MNAIRRSALLYALSSLIIALFLYFKELDDVQYIFLILSSTTIIYSKIKLQDKTDLGLMFIFSILIISQWDLFFTGTILFYIFIYLIHKESYQMDELQSIIHNNIWNNTSEILFVKDKELRYKIVNHGWRDLFGLSEDQYNGKTDTDLFQPEIVNSIQTTDRIAIKHGEHSFIHSVIDKDNKQKYMVVLKQAIFDKKGNFMGLFGIARDITELEEIKQYLIKQNSILEKAFEFTQNAIFIKTPDSRYTYVNKAYCDIHNKAYDEIIGKSDFDLFDEETAEMFTKVDKELIKNGKKIIRQVTINFNNKQYTTITTKDLLKDSDGQILGIIGVSQDISEIKSMERQIMEAEKLHSIETLAGGIAHDLNNILTGVQGYSSILLMELEHPEYTEYLNNIINSTKYASRLISKLLIYSRKQKDQIVNLNINSLIHDTYELLKPTIKKNISIHFNLFSTGIISGDPAHIGQVIMNLMLNSAEAIKGDGEIVLETENVVIDDLRRFRFISEMASIGEYVKFRINDTGIGIAEDKLSIIFEPFYSGKERAGAKSGTGLGLSIVLNVVKSHSGLLDIVSELGKGTSICIYFPLEKNISKTNEESFKEIYTGKGTILIVDDEKNILKILTSMLEKLGYTVISTTNGYDAVELYKDNKSTIKGVIIDLLMPEIDGYQTLNELLRINPDVKSILCSGFGRQEGIDNLLERGFKGFIAKPFDIETVSIRIHELFN